MEGVWTTTMIARNSITERIKEVGFVIQEVSKRGGQRTPVACAMASAVMYIQGASWADGQSVTGSDKPNCSRSSDGTGLKIWEELYGGRI